MALPSGQYVKVPDNRGDPHFTFVEPPSALGPNTSAALNSASFLHEEMAVTPRRSGLLATDFTVRDDVLIAVLSLVLLLAIEGIVTAVLLRTSGNRLSNFGFSVKHFVDLVREFRFRHLLRGRGTTSARTAINFRLLQVALLFLFSTFAVEVLVLFLSQPTLRPVSNASVSLGLLQPIAPEWRLVRFHSRVSMDRPCTALSLASADDKPDATAAGLDQGKTSISTCLTPFESSVDTGLPREGSVFEKTRGNVDYTLVSDLHRYGAEHRIMVGREYATYSARAFFTLDDGKERVMCERGAPTRVEEQVFHVHRQYLAYLFTTYLRATKDGERVNVDALNEVAASTLSHNSTVGPRVQVLQRAGGLSVPSTRFVTNFTGPSVGDKSAVVFAQAVFKAGSGISLDTGDETDLMLTSGERELAPETVWSEKARDLNWFSLLLALIVAVLALLMLRLWFRPVGVADTAGQYVKGLIGAGEDRAPLEMDDREKPYFYVGLVSNGTDYHYGAETDDGWMRVLEDYDDKPVR